jgi:hypothetical protein
MWFKILILFLIANTTWAHREFWGKKVSVGNGYSRSYAKLTDSGHLLELSVIISKNALHNLGHADKEYVLAMPAGVIIPPYKFITLNWNPHGHEPDHVYTLPHFDLHYYFISRAEQTAITCMNEDAVICTKAIAADLIPAKYIPTPAGVPQMGWHWVDSTSGEFNGKKFTKTFIYGYYNGNMTFIEPMVTFEYLKNTSSSTKVVQTPKAVTFEGSYPTSYRIKYDRHDGVHKIVLRKFKTYSSGNL